MYENSSSLPSTRKHSSWLQQDCCILFMVPHNFLAIFIKIFLENESKFAEILTSQRDFFLNFIKRVLFRRITNSFIFLGLYFLGFTTVPQSKSYLQHFRPPLATLFKKVLRKKIIVQNCIM